MNGFDDSSVENGPYELLHELGGNETVRVFEARHVYLDRIVALRVLARGPHVSESVERRFLVQARTNARLHHPNICTVLDAGYLPDGSPFVALERLGGADLRQLLEREGRLPLRRALAIATQIFHALEAAHGARVLHGNLQPQSVHVERGPDTRDRVKVRGFAAVDLDGGRSSGEDLLGAPAYLSPEAVAGEPADERSDIFSAALLLYEMLTGENPLRGESLRDTILLQRASVPDIRARHPELAVPPTVAALLADCLDPTRENRPYPARLVARRLIHAGL